MRTTIIRVYGFARSKPCDHVTTTFYCADEADFAYQVAEWEKTNDIFEWSRSVVSR